MYTNTFPEVDTEFVRGLGPVIKSLLITLFKLAKFINILEASKIVCIYSLYWL